jgi:hypothetical protein
LRSPFKASSSLSDLKNRSENSADRGQILTISPGNSRSIAQESGEIWIDQADLQPIYFKSDRLLVHCFVINGTDRAAQKRPDKARRAGNGHSLVKRRNAGRAFLGGSLRASP